MASKVKNYVIREVKPADIPAITEILNVWIRWQLKIDHAQVSGDIIPYEVQTTLSDVAKSFQHQDGYWYYALVEKQGKILGMVGLRPPAMNLTRYINNQQKSGEMLNLFFAPEAREKGLEMKLIDFLFAKAKTLGYQNICWDSGPRYKDTLWPFYKEHFGEPTAIGKGFYDKLDSQIWTVDL